MMMLATGKLFPAAHALSIGLINEVHAPEALDEAVDALATLIASKSAQTLARGKRSFAGQAELALPEAYRFAQEQALESFWH